MKKLSEIVENAFYQNILNELPDDEFLNIIEANFDNLLKIINNDYDRFTLQLLQEVKEISNRRDMVISLWGKYIDLKKLDFLRKKQIHEMKEKFIDIKKLVGVYEWISGSTSIVFIGKDEKKHNIKVNYPYDNEIVIPNCLVGAIYYDEKLVPIQSELETNIILSLKDVMSENIVLKEVLQFLTSKAYIDLNIRIGRIS
jgi:hypothetical protein